MHCDTISRIHKHPEASLRSNNFQLDLIKMKSSGYLLQNFAMFIDLDETDRPYDTCKEQIAIFQQEMDKNRDLIRPRHYLIRTSTLKMKTGE